MTTASYRQIVDLLGEVDDLYVRRIEETGASLDEISEALAAAEQEDRIGAAPRAASSPRVATVRAILEEALDDPDPDPELAGREA